jgi:hypothetical protein
MDGGLCIVPNETLVLHIAKRKNNFQKSHIKPQIHLIVDYI